MPCCVMQHHEAAPNNEDCKAGDGEERRGEESQAGEISEEIYYNVLNSMSERNQPARQS